MPLHRLSSYTYSVPDPESVIAYYRDFGLADNGDGSMSTANGGRQLYVKKGPYRAVTALEIGADDPDDLARVHADLKAAGFEASLLQDRLLTRDPVTGIEVSVVAQPRSVEEPVERAPVNGPGRVERVNARADGVVREGPVRPRRLGHVALVSAESETSLRFFVDGLGFKISDYAGDKSSAFLRCSPDHHNIAVFSGPASFPHHSSWQVDDVDDIGRAAESLLEEDSDRQVWGFGRHFAGSNFFWYLKDPAGTFSEYYADMDHITDDDMWAPQVCSGKSGLYRWGPTPGSEFMTPKDVGEILAAQAAT